METIIFVLCFVVLATTVGLLRKRNQKVQSTFPLKELPVEVQAKIVQKHLDIKSRAACIVAGTTIDKPSDLKRQVLVEMLEKLVDSVPQSHYGLFEAGVDGSDIFVSLHKDYIEIHIVEMYIDGRDLLVLNNFLASSGLQYEWTYLSDEESAETGIPTHVRLYHPDARRTRAYNIIFDVLKTLEIHPVHMWQELSSGTYESPTDDITCRDEVYQKMRKLMGVSRM
jgi:hypothetical protein